MAKIFKRDNNPATRRVPYSRFWWNENAQRYIGANGRFVSPDAVRDVVDDNLDHAGDRMAKMGKALKDAAQQLQDGKITHDQYILATKGWRDAMASEVRNVHLANAMAAKGGFHAMTDADANTVKEYVANQYEYLNVFAAQSAMYPDYVLTAGFDDRAQMYAQAGRGTHEQFAAGEAIKNGFIYVRNILEKGAHHCTGEDSCIEMTSMGKVFADDPLYLLPGFRKCLTRCKCKSKRTKK